MKNAFEKAFFLFVIIIKINWNLSSCLALGIKAPLPKGAMLSGGERLSPTESKMRPGIEQIEDD